MSRNVRLLRAPRLCNEPVDGFLDKAEKAAMMAAAAKKLEELFDVLQIDHSNDHNMRDTPRRVAKMFVEEVLHGRYSEPPKITEFENVERYDQLIVTGPIEVRSMCAHHLMPIVGEAYIGILPSPDGKIIGLSKYDRIVEYFCVPAADPGRAGRPDRQLHHRDDQAARPRACASARCTCARRIAACAPARRAAWSTARSMARCCATRSSRTSSCRNAFRSRRHADDGASQLRWSARPLGRRADRDLSVDEELRSLPKGCPCCFRQWRATSSHCRLIHGYALAFKFVFATRDARRTQLVLRFRRAEADPRLAARDVRPHHDRRGGRSVIWSALRELGHAGWPRSAVLPAVGCEAVAKFVSSTHVGAIVRKESARTRLAGKRRGARARRQFGELSSLA